MLRPHLYLLPFAMPAETTTLTSGLAVNDVPPYGIRE
jgi:hypothetical protein